MWNQAYDCANSPLCLNISRMVFILEKKYVQKLALVLTWIQTVHAT
jgi:hypothetical protein